MMHNAQHNQSLIESVSTFRSDCASRQRMQNKPSADDGMIVTLRASQPSRSVASAANCGRRARTGHQNQHSTLGVATRRHQHTSHRPLVVAVVVVSAWPSASAHQNLKTWSLVYPILLSSPPSSPCAFGSSLVPFGPQIALYIGGGPQTNTLDSFEGGGMCSLSIASVT